ncbi:GNAT family N-acetyltransferase [Aquabacterium sp.]|uniref:GNAT family N-acetyltransferase n=1 Tax=Aquabacterium sp. TaxID=1872578 RepID=UPI002E319661|nr:GNAT family N-acetyltransferase [Aquabacterium sp.]HEX5312668.1 GNAT family N-acetyltransferase [Aquabacterium sp.]
MSLNNTGFRIVISRNDVQPWVDEVNKAADSDKDSLGFFPSAVYREFANKEQLLVALIHSASDNTEAYAGHLLFSASAPKATVRQLFVLPTQRSAGVGRALVDALKRHLADLNYISIYARVADDLRGANVFWESQGFYTQRVTQGGIARKRMLHVRAHELPTLQLFATSGIDSANPLGLTFNDVEGAPQYLLDLNVLFDLGPRRPRHESAVSIFKAERIQACSLAVSTEIDVELKRHAYAGKTDPMQALAGTLPKFPIPDQSFLDDLLPRLALIVFPERASGNRLTSNDKSDLRHLATAIYHKLPGLVTNERRIQDCSPQLRKQFGIEAISPEAFQISEEDRGAASALESSDAHLITLESATVEDEREIQSLLTDVGIPKSEQAGPWAAFGGDSSVVARMVTRCDGALLGYMSWTRSISSDQIWAHIASSEKSEGGADGIRAMLIHLQAQPADEHITRIRLICADKQVSVKELAVGFGYTQSASRPNEMQKIVVRRLITPSNWEQVRHDLNLACDILLPDCPRSYRGPEQELPVKRVDGEQAHISLTRLESLLAPALFCLPGRSGVLVPILRPFAEQLFHDSPQGSLLPMNKAQLAPQRQYISDSRTLRKFAQGDLIFFYESGKRRGRGAVIAVGRVTSCYVLQATEASEEDVAGSVLSIRELNAIGTSKTKTITAFDNLIRLSHPVSQLALKEIGCGEAHQLISTQRLSSDQVQAIIGKGIHGQQQPASHFA